MEARQLRRLEVDHPATVRRGGAPLPQARLQRAALPRLVEQVVADDAGLAGEALRHVCPRAGVQVLHPTPGAGYLDVVPEGVVGVVEGVLDDVVGREAGLRRGGFGRGRSDDGPVGSAPSLEAL